jgi:hypothetical protein
LTEFDFYVVSLYGSWCPVKIMASRYFGFSLPFACLLASLPMDSLAQERPVSGIQKNGVPAVVPKAKPGMSPTGLPIVMNKAPGVGVRLSGNFLITLTVKESERQVGEVVVLTSSSTVKTQANLDTSSTPESVSFEGTLEEQESGLFAWDYVLGYKLPITTSTSGTAGSQLRTTIVEYQSYSSQGSALIRIGRSYDLLKSGGRTYSVTITPAAEP